MNSLYTLGVRQTSSIQADLERLRSGDSSASLSGQISASLAAMSRTIDDYDSMARREMIKAKQEKATARVQKFRADYTELRKEFERLKSANEEQQRTELLATSSASAHPSASTRLRYASTASPSASSAHSENPFSNPPSSTSNPYSSQSREDFALREHSFTQNTHAQLDDFIAQGREVLDNLVDQRNMLKGTQRRLLDAANTLGLSRDVIGWIERRSTQDMWIFVAGAIFTFFCFWAIWHYLG